jgi:hypothetical protein
MAPVKFDDIPKVSKSLLEDDFQVSGYQFKSKAKSGANAFTTTVDILTAADQKIKTPSKVSVKLPDFMGFKGLTVEKLEVDKSGAQKLEATLGKALHSVDALSLELKSDSSKLDQTTAGMTYSGIADTQIKFETKPLNPSDFTFEVTRAVGAATLGVKAGAKNVTKPDLGLRYQTGPFFVSVLAKEQFGAIHGNAHYKINDQIQLAAACQLAGAALKQGSAGVQFEVSKDCSLKAKVALDGQKSAGLKYKFGNGLTVMAGAAAGKSFTTGFQASIE